MKKLALPLTLLSAIALSGCIITDTDGDWDDATSVAERTRLAIEACGQGNVKEVTSRGFECKSSYDGASN